MVATIFDRSLAALRLQHEAVMPHRVQVHRQVETRVPGGGTTMTYQPVAGASYPCRWVPLTVKDQLVAMQTKADVAGQLAVPAGTVIAATDQLVVSGEDPDGTPFLLTLAVIGNPGVRSLEAVRYILCANWTAGS